MEFTFNQYHAYAKEGIFRALKELCKEEYELPVIVCIGSDLSICDSFGPLVGTMLESKGLPCYLYGTLRHPVTARELKYLDDFLSNTNPHGKRLVVDAAVGERNEIGLIRVQTGGLYPGKGVQKNYRKFGDLSILGIDAERSLLQHSLTELTRLRLVYQMAQTVSDALYLFLNNINLLKAM